MTYLREFKNGELVRSVSGRLYRIRRIRKPRQHTQFIEPVYRLQSMEFGTLGTQEFTHEELQYHDVTPVND